MEERRLETGYKLRSDVSMIELKDHPSAKKDGKEYRSIQKLKNNNIK